MRDLCEFVDLAYEPAMLEEFGREAVRNVGRGEAWKRDVSRGVILDRKGVWRTRMTPGQAWLVAQAMPNLVSSSSRHWPTSAADATATRTSSFARIR